MIRFRGGGCCRGGPSGLNSILLFFFKEKNDGWGREKFVSCTTYMRIEDRYIYHHKSTKAGLGLYGYKGKLHKSHGLVPLRF